MFSLMHMIAKPIFHQNVKPFMLGPRIGSDNQRDPFKLEIPTCWYLKTLADQMQPPT